MQFGISSATLTGIGGLVLATLCPSQAYAAPGNQMVTSGSVQANVVEPSRIQLLDDMRFGAFISPVSAGTITVSPTGTVSTAGGLNGLDAVPQPATGRGPASFMLDGTNSRLFISRIPNQITISNGTSSMQVQNLNSNLGVFGLGFFGPSGQFTLKVGGTLNVNANQEVGNYTGTFDVTVLYL